MHSIFDLTMDVRSYFSKASTSSTSASRLSSSGSEEESEVESLELEVSPPSPKKHCTSIARPTTYTSTKKRAKYRSTTSSRKYNTKWEKDFSWLEYDEDSKGAFCKVCRKSGKSLQRTGGVWVTKPFTNWKKAVEKMKAHEKSDLHSQANLAALAAEGALREGSIVQQLQKVDRQERIRNRAAIKSLIRCTHFLTRQHIPHITNFDKVVDLVVACGGEDLKYFLENAGRNAMYTSHIAVVEFVEALGMWVEDALLKRLKKASYYSIMADECTDVTTVEELSIFCRWEEDGLPVEHFLEIVHLQKANAESIHSALIECLKKKDLQVGRIVGMGFDGAATFSGKKSGIQARMKKFAPHALFVHCHCHMLQLACVQAANSTPGIKHVYTTLTALWKFFHYSPKRTESLKEVQRVLDMPELKIIKPSDTRWLAHEKCVKGVKASYAAIVTALDNIHDATHEPEALGLSKALSKKQTTAAIFLLDYTLPQVAKLNKTLQTENLDLSIVASLVDSTLHTLEDAVTPAANWVLELLEECVNLETATGTEITPTDITTFQETIAKPFIATLKDNISSRFASSGDVLLALSIFDPKKLPADSHALSHYGEDAISTLLTHYGTDISAETLHGEETVKEAMISPDISTEWKTFRQFMAKQPKENMKLQLKELATNEMLKSMFPNLNTLAIISLSIPVATASVERSFSQMKLIKSRLRNRLSDTSLSHLLKIAIESPDTLQDCDLEEIVDMWNRKGRRIAV